MSNQDHWIKAYESKDTENLGWYEETPQPSIDLINQIKPDKTSRILNVGAGSSTLVDFFINENYSNILVNDISPVAIQELKSRLGDNQSKVEYIIDDLTNPSLLNQMADVDIWHDRAVLHFFREDNEKKAYFDLLRSKVKKGGHVIIAEFSLNGALKCSGLELCRYDEKSISDQLGSDFKLLKAFDHTFINPNGDERPYIYTLYQRTEK